MPKGQTVAGGGKKIDTQTEAYYADYYTGGETRPAKGNSGPSGQGSAPDAAGVKYGLGEHGPLGMSEGMANSGEYSVTPMGNARQHHGMKTISSRKGTFTCW